jgi:hypothetical protein
MQSWIGFGTLLSAACSSTPSPSATEEPARPADTGLHENPIPVLFLTDYDEDGLPDTWEHLVDADPDRPDTDGDGLPDAADALYHHANYPDGAEDLAYGAFHVYALDPPVLDHSQNATFHGVIVPLDDCLSFPGPCPSRRLGWIIDGNPIFPMRSDEGFPHPGMYGWFSETAEEMGHGSFVNAHVESADATGRGRVHLSECWWWESQTHYDGIVEHWECYDYYSAGTTDPGSCDCLTDERCCLRWQPTQLIASFAAQPETDAP